MKSKRGRHPHRRLPGGKDERPTQENAAGVEEALKRRHPIAVSKAAPLPAMAKPREWDGLKVWHQGAQAKPLERHDWYTGELLASKDKETDPSDVASKLLDRYEKENKGDGQGAMFDAWHYAEDKWKSSRNPELKKKWNHVQDALDSIRDDSESEPLATVVFGDDEEPHTISHYSNNTDGEFEAHWKSTDAWRGYAVVEPTDKNKWTEVVDDNILAYSEDARELEKFDAILREAMDENGIRYARAFTTSSNVFSSGYDLYVEADQAERVESLVNMLKPIYRDPETYAVTAITGKDRPPGGYEQQDRAIAAVAVTWLSKEPKENKQEQTREILEAAGFDPKKFEHIIKDVE